MQELFASIMLSSTMNGPINFNFDLQKFDIDFLHKSFLTETVFFFFFFYSNFKRKVISKALDNGETKTVLYPTPVVNAR